MERYNRLAGARRPGNASRTAPLLFNNGTLIRMEKDGPPLPRIIERSLELLDAGNDTEAALRLGVIERR